MAGPRNQSPLVFDFSRTVSRIGRGHATGIDRVERAYIEHFLNQPHPIFFLARFRGAAVLIDKQSMRDVLVLIQNNGPWSSPSITDIFRHPKRRQTAAMIRTLREASLSGRRLGAMLRKHIPTGFIYLNVGHGRLQPKLWPALRRGGAGTIAVMIHDLIPLDFPQYTTAKSSQQFGVQMQAVSEHADLFIFNSTDTKNRMQNWQRTWGHVETEGHVALLGTEPLLRPEAPPKVSHPYFVCLGTIEPRKNHRLLLDIWNDFHQTLPSHEVPHLHIVGSRGWLNADVFETLDTAAFMDKTVFEHTQMPDDELGKLLSGARGLLFPSFAEGFGYPLVEALQMKVPVLCSDLACFHEIANEMPIYINTQNRQGWRDQILQLSTSDTYVESLMKNISTLPKWNVHFHKIAAILLSIK